MLPSHPNTPEPALPTRLVGKLGGWSNKAQHFPIFSQTWFYYRGLGFVFPMTIFGFGLIAIVYVMSGTKEDVQDVRVVMPVLWATIFICLLLGRGLAVKVRNIGMQRLWSQRTLSIAIGLCIALGIAASISVAHYTKRLEKNKTSALVIEPLGNKSQTDKELKTVQLEDIEHKVHVVNLVLGVFLMIWWGGAFDFIAYLRQIRAIDNAVLQEKLERYRHEKNQAEMRLSVLASQVEPHFLFNTLSGVRAAMLSDPARGVVIIDHLVDYLRSTIPQMRSDGSCQQSSLQNQFESVRAYLGVIQARLPRLSYIVESPPELLQLAVPPLMLISLVENAVKHGVELKKGPVSIQVSARKIKTDGVEKLALCVKDNGLGFGGIKNVNTGSGIGLANIRERLKQLYGNEASLSLQAGDDGGVEASIFLPIEPLTEFEPAKLQGEA